MCLGSSYGGSDEDVHDFDTEYIYGFDKRSKVARHSLVERDTRRFELGHGKWLLVIDIFHKLTLLRDLTDLGGCLARPDGLFGNLDDITDLASDDAFHFLSVAMTRGPPAQVMRTQLGKWAVR